MLEAVLIMPIAISLMAGGIEFGRVLSSYATADKSMRDAARYLARVPEASICGWGLTNAQNLAVYGKLNPSGGDPPLIPGWGVGNVTLQSPNCGAGLVAPVIIELRAAVPYTVVMLSAVGLSNSVTLRVKHQERHIGE
jgi:hypothetical protein